MSTSTNAGKVMLGADGCPLRGHDGKIVLADNLYPARLLSWYISGWYRGTSTMITDIYHTPLVAADCVSPVDGKDWSSGSTALGVYYDRTVIDFGGDPYWRVVHHTPQYVQKHDGHVGPDSIAVPWSRVSKVKINWRVWANSRSASAHATNFAIGTATATTPSGSNEPWTGSGWTHLATVQPDGSQDIYDVLASGSFTLTPTSSGLTWYLGVYASEPGGTGSIGHYNVPCYFDWWITKYGGGGVADYPQVIYNLAT
jgi:hypothetical protein